MQIIAGIQILRDEEGDSVQIVSDNADFNGLPNCLIVCCGSWTDWEDRRFTADTLFLCITQAVLEKAAFDSRSPACKILP